MHMPLSVRIGQLPDVRALSGLPVFSDPKLWRCSLTHEVVLLSPRRICSDLPVPFFPPLEPMLSFRCASAVAYSLGQRRLQGGS